MELAQNIGTMKDQGSKLKMALEASAKLEKQLGRFSSHQSPVKRTSLLNDISENIGEDHNGGSAGMSDQFERDEDATHIGFSQSLGLGKSSVKNQSDRLNDSWFSRSRESPSETRAGNIKQEELMNLREADHEQDDLDADDEDLANRTPLSLANDTDLNFTQTRIDDSFLYSDDRTNTIGGNSSINFGLSGGNGYFQNNLQGMLEAAQAEGRIKRDENGNLVEGTVAAG